MVLIINLLFIVFYEVDAESGEIVLAYLEAEITVELLGIFQAFISFIVMAAYILRYHGKIYQEYLEQVQTDKKQSFTSVKGSIGYASGAEVYKLAAHQSSEATVNTSKASAESAKYMSTTQQVTYAFHIFLRALTLDTYHAFHVVYFILSVLGVFYHTIFSFLLLDIVIKIPLLQSVVQAIV
jgi:hypothetical protein